MRLRPEKREWDVLRCTVPLPFLRPDPPPHPGLSRNFPINMSPPIKKLPRRTICVQAQGAFSMVDTTSVSRPASNLIPKRLISHLSAGAYAALTIKKRVGRTVCVQAQDFFYGWNNLCIPACQSQKNLHRQRTRGSRPYGHSDALPNGIKSDRRNSCRFFAV